VGLWPQGRWAASCKQWFSTNGAKNKGGGQRENVPGVVRVNWCQMYPSTKDRAVDEQKLIRLLWFSCMFLLIQNAFLQNKQTTPDLYILGPTLQKTQNPNAFS
jgi:hypothetical protein